MHLDGKGTPEGKSSGFVPHYYLITFSTLVAKKEFFIYLLIRRTVLPNIRPDKQEDYNPIIQLVLCKCLDEEGGSRDFNKMVFNKIKLDDCTDCTHI